MPPLTFPISRQGLQDIALVNGRISEKSFRRYRLNMTKIESRPSKRKAWEYFFFVDCDGHGEDGKVARAIVQLQEHCSFVKVLGSYPNTE